MKCEPSSSSLHPQHRHRHRHRRRRRRHSPRAPCSNSTPSPGLLSLLATVVSSSLAAQASPVALSFLCPGIEDDSYRSDFDKLPRHRARASVDVAPIVATKKKGRRLRLPDRYVQGDDGSWQKTNWNLYGSTMCSNCASSNSESTTSTPSLDDSAQAESASITPSSAPDHSDFMKSLPPGWKPLSHKASTGVTLAVSLTLAFFICFFIICCVMWRKGTKRTKDVEKHTGRKRKSSSGDELESMIDTELKSKKILARATARWRANARYTARQRRGRRRLITSEANHSNVPIHHTESDTPRGSPTSSRRSSIASMPTQESHTALANPALTEPPTDEHSSSRPSSPVSHNSHSPPAYPHNSLQAIERAILSPVRHSKPLSRESSTQISRVQSRRPSHSSLPPSSYSDMFRVDQSMSYTPSHHKAHVATDDKALLEQLNQLSSAPEAATLSTRYDTTICAPVWRDEELDDFVGFETLSSDHAPDASGDPYPRSLPNVDGLLFPPPPVPPEEKGKAVDYYAYDTYRPDSSFPYRYGHDILDVDPEAGPSAPPFEAATEPHGESPSAPLFEPIESTSSERVHPTAPPADVLEELSQPDGVIEMGAPTPTVEHVGDLDGELSVNSAEPTREESPNGGEHPVERHEPSPSSVVSPRQSGDQEGRTHSPTHATLPDYAS